MVKTKPIGPMLGCALTDESRLSGAVVPMPTNALMVRGMRRAGYAQRVREDANFADRCGCARLVSAGQGLSDPDNAVQCTFEAHKNCIGCRISTSVSAASVYSSTSNTANWFWFTAEKAILIAEEHML